MSITTALEARRDALREREAGFTLIELLVVVLIIGILAAIAIPVYLGVQNSAKDSGVKQDLSNARTALVAASTNNSGAQWTTVTINNTANPFTATSTFGTGAGAATADLVKLGWTKSPNTTSFAFTNGTNGTFCLLGTSSTGNTFKVTSQAGPIANGTSTTCAAA